MTLISGLDALFPGNDEDYSPNSSSLIYDLVSLFKRANLEQCQLRLSLFQTPPPFIVSSLPENETNLAGKLQP